MNNLEKCTPHCQTLSSLWLIKSEAERKACRYRHDPFLREIHEQYAEALESVIQAGKESAHV